MRGTIKSLRRGEASFLKFRRISAGVVSHTSAKYGFHFGMRKLRGGTERSIALLRARSEPSRATLIAFEITKRQRLAMQLFEVYARRSCPGYHALNGVAHSSSSHVN